MSGPLHPHLAALEAALSAAATPSRETDASIQRLGRALLRAAGSDKALASLAARLAAAPADGVVEAAGEVVRALRERGGAAPASAGAILVIEDDLVARAIVEAALQSVGASVVGVGTAEEAWEVLGERAVALVILDLVLPDADGRNLLVRLREEVHTSAVPVFVLSAKIGEQPRSECLALGAEGFFEKPVDGEALASAVRRRLAARTEPLDPRDPVTGLWTRGVFAEMLRASGPATHGALAAIDLDGFERFTGRHGREAALELLRSFAETLGTVLEPGDAATRWGRDEFLAFFQDRSVEDAVTGLKTLRNAVTTDRTSQPGVGPARVRFSAGVTVADAGFDLDDVVAEAERWVFEAKLQGGDRILADQPAAPVSRTISIVEDDPVTAAIVKHRLERDGFTVRVFGDGADAFDAASTFVPVLWILDIKLPGMDGYELLERLRKNPEHRQVPIVLLTALGGERDVIRSFELGADDYITKPFAPNEVVARVRRQLRRARRGSR